MKNITKLFSVAVLMVAVSCTQDISSLNTNPKSYTNVPGPTLFTNAQQNLVSTITSTNVNTNIWRLITQQWTETTYTDETRYDLATRNIPQNYWNALYVTTLRDLKEARTIILKDPDTETRANMLAIIDLHAVYTYHILVNTFGDIPYTKALDFDNLTPVYDDAATISLDLLARIDADLTALKTTSGSFTGGADIVYGGNVSKWIKFANSLKLRIAISLADSHPTQAKAAAEAASTHAGGLILTNTDNAKFAFLSATPNTNPVWVDLVQSGRQDFVAGKTVVDLMNARTDPRRAQFFTFDQTGSAYSGGSYGVGNSFGAFSKPSAKLSATTFPGVLIDAAETEFNLAEGVARGYTIAGTAQTHYNNAITNSILDWGGTAGDATTYLALTNVDYSNAGSGATYKEKIGIQKYLSNYNRPMEAWTDYRRLDFPAMNPVTAALSTYPMRYTYPVSEQNLNTANFNSAAGKMTGGDLVSNKLFWDKF